MAFIDDRFVLDDFDTAMSKNQVDEWIKSQKVNMMCSSTLETEMAKNYDFNSHIFHSDEVLKNMSGWFCPERLKFIIAVQAFDKERDERYSKESIRWAKNVMDSIPDWLKERKGEFRIQSHSGLIDLLIKKCIQKEKETQEAKKMPNRAEPSLD